MSGKKGNIAGIAGGTVAVVTIGVWLAVRFWTNSDVLPADAETARSSVPAPLGRLATGNSEAEKYKGPPLTGMVRTPAGAPVGGARVTVATWRNPVEIVLDGPATKDVAAVSAETGADGRFTFQPDARPRALFVRSPQGYAFTTVTGSASSGSGPVQVAPLTLQPWGRVEAQVGSAVEPGSRFDCSLDVRFAQAGIFFGINSPSSPNSHLALDQVPAGKFVLAVRAAQRQAFSHSYEFQVRPGQTVTAQVGLPGRVVSGRVDKPMAGFGMRRATLTATSSSVTETLDCVIERDGTFHFEPVAAGQYLLRVRLWASTGNGYEPAGDTQRTIEVAQANGPGEKPVDLGLVAVDVPDRFGIGQRANDIEAIDASGARVTLSQFRGRYVLLSFTDGPGSNGWSDVVGLRPLYDRFGPNSQLAIVTCYTGSAFEKTRSEAVSAGVNWPVLDCGSSAGAVPTQFAGTKHSISVIDPQGIILASKVDVFAAWAVLDAVLHPSGSSQPAGTLVQMERLLPPNAKGEFKKIAPPAADDAGAKATITTVDGTYPEGQDPRSCLNDGKMAADDDSPTENFRFAIGTLEGRVRFDLRSVIPIAAVRSYSWHANSRAPQLYRVYGADGAASGFEPSPKFGTDPRKCGWTLIANVDTRPASGPPGGKHAVDISHSSGLLGQYRYLLFEMFPTETDDGNGNTFYSEIDVIRRK